MGAGPGLLWPLWSACTAAARRDAGAGLKPSAVSVCACVCTHEWFWGLQAMLTERESSGSVRPQDPRADQGPRISPCGGLASAHTRGSMGAAGPPRTALLGCLRVAGNPGPGPARCWPRRQGAWGSRAVSLSVMRDSFQSWAGNTVGTQ